MKYAFLILAHQSPEVLMRLIHALDDPRFDLFVHLDSKADRSAFHFENYRLQHSRLSLLPQRYHAYWGSIFMTDAMIALYRCAFAHDDYSRFIMLSGEDYPVLSNDDIYTYLSDDSREFIRPVNLPLQSQVTGYWFWPLRNLRAIKLLQKILSKCGIRKEPYLFIDGKQWPVYKSSQWHALSRSSVAHILSTLDRHPSIRKYFTYSFSSDSLLIPTILYNSPEFRQKMFLTDPDSMKNNAFNTRPVLHYLQYKYQKGSSVEIFDETSLDAILSSGKLFIRKVRSGTSDILMDMLDQSRRQEG